jgi:SARP family transcriptional regulator, regulator of embCAB operon
VPFAKPRIRVAGAFASVAFGVYARCLGYAAPSAGTLSRFGSDLSSGLRVLLLGRFGLAEGVDRVALAPASQRLLAYVALAGRVVRRDLAAGALWPAVVERYAHGSLRAALARLAARAPGVLQAEGRDVSLGAEVDVDLHDTQVIARRLLRDPGAVGPDDAAAAIGGLSEELLPGWYDDWALVEAENSRQLRLPALEAVAGVLAGAERFGEAVGAAQGAVDADPLRESPHAALIAVHLREGNQSEALREFERYRARLQREFGLEPTPRLRALLPG